MRAWGIPARTLREIRAAVTDMWSSGPGGWTYEWTRHAQVAERQERWLLAAALYGGARFPVACTPER